MGVFSVRVEVGHPLKGHFEGAELVVDTGATFSVLPRSLLDSIGVEATEQAEIKMADGRGARLRHGRGPIQAPERPGAHQPVVFAPADDVYLFGAVTLEEFGLVPDTDGARLVPAQVLLMHIDGAVPGQRLHFS